VRPRQAVLTFLYLCSALLAANLAANLIFGGFKVDLLIFKITSNQVGPALFYFLISLVLLLAVQFRLPARIIGLLKRRFLANSLLVLASLALTVLAFELLIRPFGLVLDAGNTFVYQPGGQGRGIGNDHLSQAQADPQLGYIPLMGGDYLYAQTGTLKNDYPLQKRPGWRRVLFLGDSITALGLTQAALRKKLGRSRIELWNAGVHGYGTGQEIGYFSRFARRIKPDAVVLQFCLNDFDGTPVLIKNALGKTIVANANFGAGQFNRWLFRNSIVYRSYLSIRLALSGRVGLAEDVADHLQKLAGMADEDGFGLSVVVYPWLERAENWPERYRRQRQDILAILERLRIRRFDLAPLLEEELKGHPAAWAQEWPARHDRVHPSRAFSRVIAEYLLNQGLLDQLCPAG